jgi:hypothetical protein
MLNITESPLPNYDLLVADQNKFKLVSPDANVFLFQDKDLPVSAEYCAQLQDKR